MLVAKLRFFRNRNSQFRKIAIFRNPFYNPAAGTMSIQTRRNYESGWYQDYQYNLPFPVGDLNVFLADMTSGGASKPENVPVSSKVQIINEKKRGQSFLTETGPTTAEAVFTTDGGNEYRLLFANYHRFAGFSTDGIFAVAGTAESFDLGSITFLSSDYSTLTDGFYTEKLTIDDQECTLTYRPIGRDGHVQVIFDVFGGFSNIHI